MEGSGFNKLLLKLVPNLAQLGSYLAPKIRLNLGLIQYYMMNMVHCDLRTKIKRKKKSNKILSKYIHNHITINLQDAKAKEIEDVLILSGDHLYRMDYMDFVQVN